MPLQHHYDSISTAIGATELYELGHYEGVDTWVYLTLAKYPIDGFSVGILGSVEHGLLPLYESIVFSHGGSPMVVRYNKITYEHDWMVSKINYSRESRDPAF